MAAWLLGLAVVLATATRENDLERIRIATASYVVLGVLQLVAAARYASDLRGGAACVLYLAFLVLLVATGLVGVALGRRSP